MNGFKFFLLLSLFLSLIISTGCGVKSKANKLIAEGDKVAQAGNYEGALEIYKQAKEIAPSYDKAQQKLDECRANLLAHYTKEIDTLVAEGKYEDAVDVCNKIVKVDPTKSDAMDAEKEKIEKLSKQEELKGKLEQAIELIEKEKDYEKALELLTDVTDLKSYAQLPAEISAKTHFYKGLCYLNIEGMGKESQAKEEFEEALEEGLEDEELKKKAGETAKFIELKEGVSAEYEMYRKDLEDWLPLLNSPDVKTRIKAYTDLGNSGVTSVFAYIVEGLKDTDVEGRIAAIKALSVLNDERAVLFLEKVFSGDKEDKVKGEAIKAIGAIGGDYALPIIKEALKEENEEIKGSSIEALVLFDPAEGKEKALEAIKGKSEILKTRAVAAIMALPASESLSFFTELLKDENKDVREIAAVSLGELGDKSALKALEEAAKVEKEDAAKKAIEKAINALQKEKEPDKKPDENPAEPTEKPDENPAEPTEKPDENPEPGEK